MDEYPDDPRDKGSYFDVIFAVIVLLTAGFSTVTTYIGFSKDLPEYMAMAIAAIIGFGLLGVNFKLRQGRLNDDPIWGALVVFMMIAVFSFISNTNAFYSFLIRDDIVRETQQAARRSRKRGAYSTRRAAGRCRRSSRGWNTRRSCGESRRSRTRSRS